MFLIPLFISLYAYNLCQAEPTASLEQGIVRGFYKKSYLGRTYSAFTGIPYAEPPVGNLRYREPKPAPKWNGELIANQSYVCKQKSQETFIGVEDCLYINIFVPREEININENLSVVVHIHGGAFRAGSSAEAGQPDFLMDKEMVYVSFNYRLGVLGFYSTNNDVIPGNFGLKDQVMALKWIRDNIRNFGGNPGSVTLTGFSAGGASVHYHYVSPMSVGLFHRGWSLSGTVLNPWSLVKRPLQDAEILANVVNCPFNSSELLQCLQNTPVDSLFAATKSKSPTKDYLVFGPVVEKSTNPFLPEHPYILMNQGKIYDVPWVSSVVRDEGLVAVGGFYNEKGMDWISKQWVKFGSVIMHIFHTVDPELKEDTMDKIKKFYFNDSEVNLDTYGTLVKAVSEREFFHDEEIAIRTQAAKNKSPVYFYFFEYLAEKLKRYGNTGIGINHGTDVGLLFKFTNMNTPLEPLEKKMILLFTTFIENFASTGKVQLGETEWKPIDSTQQELNVLDIKSADEIQLVKWDKLADNEFWESLPIKEQKKLI